MPSSPELAALLVVGDARESAQRALDSLYAQTIASAMEIVVVDMKTRDVPALSTSDRIATRYLESSSNATWAEARVTAARSARAPLLAFLEPHSTAAPTWAEALVGAGRRSWAAVGYAFVNPRPDSYLANAVIASKYGCWLHPTVSRPAAVLPCGNVAYDRQALLALGDELEQLLTPDFGVHERFREQGLGLGVEAGAVIANDSVLPLHGLVAASFLCCRLLGAHRAKASRWSRWRRLVYGLVTPVVSPLVALSRLAASDEGSPGTRSLLVYGPVIVVKAIASACGESAGYLFGAGASEPRFVRWEVHVDRSGRGGRA